MHCASEHELVDESVLRALRAFRMPGEPDPAQEVVETFLELTPARLASLRLAAQHGDSTEVRATAHVLRGSSGTVGAMAMHSVAADIEALDPNADAETLVARLEALYTRTRPELEALAQADDDP